jgi:hypothetical protein
VASKDEILSLEAVGYADIAAKREMRTDDLLWIVSMSKSMTATALMMLVDEGEVSVDDPVETYLPEFRGQMLEVKQAEGQPLLKTPAHPITVRNILTHTSGLPPKTDVERPTLDTLPLRDAVRSYAKTPLQFGPDSQWQYSNAGINTAGRIIEVVGGMPYEEFMDKRLFQPSGMRHDVLARSGAARAAGQILQASGGKDGFGRAHDRATRPFARRPQATTHARRRVAPTRSVPASRRITPARDAARRRLRGHPLPSEPSTRIGRSRAGQRPSRPGRVAGTRPARTAMDHNIRSRMNHPGDEPAMIPPRCLGRLMILAALAWTAPAVAGGPNVVAILADDLDLGSLDRYGADPSSVRRVGPGRRRVRRHRPPRARDGAAPGSFYPLLFNDQVHPTVSPLNNEHGNGGYLVDLTWFAAFYRESPEAGCCRWARPSRPSRPRSSSASPGT